MMWLPRLSHLIILLTPRTCNLVAFGIYQRHVAMSFRKRSLDITFDKISLGFRAIQHFHSDLKILTHLVYFRQPN